MAFNNLSLNIYLLRILRVTHYSQHEASEAEVLLFPGTKLAVVDVMDMGNGLFQVCCQPH